MADVISHTEQVKAVVQGVSAWMPVISALGGGVLAGGVALLVTRLNHRYAREREVMAAAERVRHEQQQAEDKRQKELIYIATELVFLLEEFAERCALVAADSGEQNQYGVSVVTEVPPMLDLSHVTGDWRVLPPKLMYRIRELPIRLTEAGKYVASAYENDFPEGYSHTFWERQYQYSRLGLKALFSAIRLRQAAGLPPTRLNATSWSVQPMLMKLWRQERRRRTVTARLHLQATAQLNVALQQSIKNQNTSGGSQ
ncbi:TPA: hypothetical protein OW286_003619 [Citrobacter freundii]|nr:hypothetical protein [Citrobacter freundii]